MNVHPTAIIHSGAKLASDVSVGPYSVIEDNVEIGAGTVIASHVVIRQYTTIGCGNRIFQFASIGEVPQDLKFHGEETRLIIGDNNQIREYVTLNRGTEGGGGLTRLGNDNLVMAYAHVAHDCLIGDGVILANAATLAGHIVVEDNASVGGLVGIHQFTRIGKFCFIGGMTAVVLDIPPFTLVSGNRAKLHGINVTGLKRQGFDENRIRDIKNAYRILFRSGLRLEEAVQKVMQEIPDCSDVDHLLKFIEESKRGVTR